MQNDALTLTGGKSRRHPAKVAASVSMVETTATILRRRLASSRTRDPTRFGRLALRSGRPGAHNYRHWGLHIHFGDFVGRNFDTGIRNALLNSVSQFFF